jgi:hypothetical protein
MYPMNIICSNLFSVLKLRSYVLAQWMFRVPKVMFLLFVMEHSICCENLVDGLSPIFLCGVILYAILSR